MRSRKRLLLTSSCLLAALVPGIAAAQAQPAPPAGANRSNAQFDLRREEAGSPDATVARQRARGGDCPGALPSFDAAVRVNVDPTLRRDRGLCHEKIGNPYPAMDDYRAYLTARPDAPDADQIREHLAMLEELVGSGGRAAPPAGDGGAQASASVSVGAQGATASASSGGVGPSRDSEVLGPKPGEPARSYDYYAAQERLADSAKSSPLRLGTGWAVGPFLMLPRYFLGEGASKDMGYALGATVRYAWSPTLTFVSEVGFVGIGESGQPTSSSGPLLFAGVELRVPLDTWATNQIYLGAGPGFERYTVSGTKVALNVFEARARLGFRHVFGPSVALDIGADGGPAYMKVSGIDIPGVEIDGKMRMAAAAAVALVVGF